MARFYCFVFTVLIFMVTSGKRESLSIDFLSFLQLMAVANFFARQPCCSKADPLKEASNSASGDQSGVRLGHRVTTDPFAHDQALEQLLAWQNPPAPEEQPRRDVVSRGFTSTYRIPPTASVRPGARRTKPPRTRAGQAGVRRPPWPQRALRRLPDAGHKAGPFCGPLPASVPPQDAASDQPPQEQGGVWPPCACRTPPRTPGPSRARSRRQAASAAPAKRGVTRREEKRPSESRGEHS